MAERPSSKAGGKTAVNVLKRSSTPQVRPSRSAARPEPSGDIVLSGTEPLLLAKGKITLPDDSPATSASVQLLQGVAGGGSGNRQVVTAATITGGDGAYRMVAPGDKVYWLRVSHPDGAPVLELLHASKGVSVQRVPGTPHQVVRKDVRLQGGGLLQGRVVGSNDMPLSSARVAVGRRADSSVHAATETTTSVDGDFRFDHAAEGDSLLVASAPGYAEHSTTLTVPSTGLLIRLNARGATLAGTVRENKSGQPLSGIAVSLKPEADTQLPVGLNEVPVTYSDSSGKFRLEHLAAGLYTIDARGAGMWPLPKRTNKYMIHLREGQTSDGIELWLYPGHTILGNVRDKDTNEPIPDVRILSGYLSGSESTSTRTAADGTFCLEGVVSANNWTQLNAEKPGYLVHTESGSGIPGVSLRSDLLEIERDIEMIKAISVSGTVKLPDGRAALLATVEPLLQHMGTFASPEPVDASGKYKLEVLPKSTFVMRASSPGYGHGLSAIVRTGETGAENVDITLSQGVDLGGRVVDPAGAAVPGANVFCEWKTLVSLKDFGGENPQIQTDASGGFNFLNMPAQQLNLIAKHTDYAPSETETITPRDGSEITTLVLTLKKGCHLAGRITDQTSRPLAQCGLRATPQGSSARVAHASTNVDGHYRFESLPEGRVDLYVYSEGSNQTFENVETCRDDADFQIHTAPRTTFTGKVVDYKTRQPLPNWEVTSEQDVLIERDPNRPGEFIIRDVPGNTCYKFTITAEGYKKLSTGDICMPADGKPMAQTFEMGPGGRVVGRAIRKSDKAPLSGIKVTLPSRNESESTAYAVTGADGRFTIESVGSGEKRQLIVLPPLPMLQVTRQVDVKPGVDNDAGDIELGAGSLIKGKVIRVPGEAPIAHTTVLSKLRGQEVSTKTEADGTFQFTGMPSGETEFQTPDFGEKSASMIVVRDDEIQEVVLRVGSTTMKGHVTKAGKPVMAEIMVVNVGSFTMRAASTDTEGFYEIPYLLPGRQMVQVESRPGNNLKINTAILFPDSGDVEKDFRFAGAGMSGRVVDEKGSPVAGARLTASAPTEWGMEERERKSNGTSAQDGSYTFTDLAPGTYSIAAEKAEVGRGTSTGIQVPESGVVTVPPVILKSNGGTLVSITHDYTTGGPLPGAKCRITAEDSVVLNTGETRGADGVLTIPRIPPGLYTVKISAANRIDVTHQVTIQAGETTRLEDVLYEATQLLVAVSDKSGAALPDVKCVLAPVDPTSIEQPRHGTTNPMGVWPAGSVPLGKYTLTATQGAKHATSTFDLHSSSHGMQMITLD